MTSYILQNEDEKKDVLLYQEKSSYTFTPKKGYKQVKKITVLDSEMLSCIWENKIAKEYERLIRIIYSLIANDDTNSGDVLVAYTELERIKQYLLSLKEKGLKKEAIKKYLKKLYILELELKKVHVMELEEEIEEERGMGR